MDGGFWKMDEKSGADIFVEEQIKKAGLREADPGLAKKAVKRAERYLSERAARLLGDLPVEIISAKVFQLVTIKIGKCGISYGSWHWPEEDAGASAHLSAKVFADPEKRDAWLSKRYGEYENGKGAKAIRDSFDRHAGEKRYFQPLDDFYWRRTCGHCGGSGEEECSTCGGKKTVYCNHCDENGVSGCPDCWGRGVELCPKCHGNGEIYCSWCGGKGWKEALGEAGRVERCFNCFGSGKVACPACDGEKFVRCRKCGGNRVIKCPKCHGTKQAKCPACSGLGIVKCGDCKGAGKIDEHWRAGIMGEYAWEEHAKDGWPEVDGNPPDPVFHPIGSYVSDDAKTCVAALASVLTIAEITATIGPYKNRRLVYVNNDFSGNSSDPWEWACHFDEIASEHEKGGGPALALAQLEQLSFSTSGLGEKILAIVPGLKSVDRETLLWRYGRGNPETDQDQCREIYTTLLDRIRLARKRRALGACLFSLVASFALGVVLSRLRNPGGLAWTLFIALSLGCAWAAIHWLRDDYQNFVQEFKKRLIWLPSALFQEDEYGYRQPDLSWLYAANPVLAIAAYGVFRIF